MRLVLFAYRTVGYECLNHLIVKKSPPVLVVLPSSETNEDLQFRSVKKYCIEQKVAHHVTDNIKNDKDLMNKLQILSPDLFFSCYFPLIIPETMLSLPKFGGLNLHGGLLPHYRGTLSGVWSIINGEIETGVTLHYMTKKIDAGNIVEISKCPIKYEDTAYDIYNRTSAISVKLFKKYYGKLERGESIPTKSQLDEEGRDYKRELPYNGLINWDWSSRKIYNFCRSLSFPGFKGAQTEFFGELFELNEVSESDLKAPLNRGELYSKNERLFAKTSTTDIELLKIKQNGRTITIKEFIGAYL